MTRWWWSLPVGSSNPEATFTSNREGSHWRLPSLVYPSATAHCDWRAATGHCNRALTNISCHRGQASNAC